MKKILQENNFLYNEEEGLWRKDNWIIRFRENNIEAYNEPCTAAENQYACLPSTMANLMNILDDINE